MTLNALKNLTAIKSINFGSLARISVVIIGGGVIVGCALPQLNIHTQKPNSYLLNPITGQYCEGFADKTISGNCQSLLAINFNAFQAKTIENVYQQKLVGTNRAAKLISIMLNSDDTNSQPQKLANDSYSLPANLKTNTVWEVLERIHKLTYAKDNYE